MNTGKLYHAMLLLNDDYEETTTVSLIADLSEHLGNLAANPAKASFQQSISGTLETMRTNLEQAPSNHYHNDWHNLMRVLGWEDCYGNNLRANIDAVMSANQITPSLAHKEIDAQHTRVKDIKKHVENILASFAFLNLEGDSLCEGECEISITIPRRHLDGKLDKFGEEIRQISKSVLPPFVESVDESPDFKIRALSSSDPTLFIEASPLAAVAILTAIKLAISIYKDLVEIKKHVAELKNLKISTAGVEKQIDERIEKLVKNATDDYLKTIKDVKTSSVQSVSPNAGRTLSELKVRIASSIQKLVVRIDAGFTMEVRGEMHTPETTADKETGVAEEKKLGTPEERANSLITQIHESKDALDYKHQGEPQLQKLLENLSSSDKDDNR